MDSPLEPSNFDLSTSEGKTKFYMTAQAEFFNCLSNLENAFPQMTSIAHTIDIELSSEDNLQKFDDLLYRYIFSLQTFHLYYQEIGRAHV